jgi:hypothetical protein
MPSNTANGLPYPLPTEQAKDGAVAIRNLAEALDAVLYGPWQTVPLNAGWSGTVRARREGGSTVLAGSVTGPWGSPGPCIVPAGLRALFPAGAGLTFYSFTVPDTASSGSVQRFANIRVWGDGSVTITQCSIPSGGTGALDIRFPSKSSAVA